MGKLLTLWVGGLLVLAIAPPEFDSSDSLVSSRNIVTLLVLAAASIPTMLVLIRMALKFQRDFTSVYSSENDKLRARVDDLEAEVQEKNQKITELNVKVGEMQTRLFMHEITIMSHENTIGHLNDIIDRRKLKRREENGHDPIGEGPGPDN